MIEPERLVCHGWHRNDRSLPTVAGLEYARHVERDLEHLTERMRNFADRRDWAKFHSPRNLVLALVGEVGELAAEVQWLTDGDVTAALAESGPRERIADELADVLIYLTRLADRCDIDLLEAAHQKVTRNEEQYPEERAKRVATKYTDLSQSRRTAERSGAFGKAQTCLRRCAPDHRESGPACALDAGR
jgi:dCTP diphosphatase